MPRDGSHIYTQPFDDVDPATTIESTVYNGFTHDVETDLNAARPIIAGGTGATSADGALQNLSGEKAAQLVTNFNTHLWMPGSFRHVANAANVGQPVLDHDFAGVCYINEALTASGTPPTNANVVVKARDLDDLDEDDAPIIPGRVYVREKRDNVWSDWVEPGGQSSGQHLILNGLRTIDITVPANKKAAKISGMIQPSGATPIALFLQLSVAASVFKSTAGDYVSHVMLHQSSTPNAITGYSNDTTGPGMLICSTHSVASAPMFIEGVFSLKRLITVGFTGNFTGTTFNSTGLCERLFSYNTLTIAAAAGALDVLAFRILNAPAGDLWTTESYLNVEWI